MRALVVGLPDQHGLESSSWESCSHALLLAANAIVVAIEMATVAGIPAPHRRRAGRARGAAVGVGTSPAWGGGVAWRGSRWRKPLRIRRPCRRSAMAVIAAVLAVVVAAIGVEAAAVRRRPTAGKGQYGERDNAQ